MNTESPHSIEISVAVIRCGCGDPEAHGRDPNGARKPCPTPARTEDRGIVASWYRNPLKRALAKIPRR